MEQPNPIYAYTDAIISVVNVSDAAVAVAVAADAVATDTDTAAAYTTASTFIIAAAAAIITTTANAIKDLCEHTIMFIAPFNTSGSL